MADHLVDGPPPKRPKLDPFQGPSDTTGKSLIRDYRHISSMSRDFLPILPLLLYIRIFFPSTGETIPATNLHQEAHPGSFFLRVHAHTAEKKKKGTPLLPFPPLPSS